MTDKHHGARVLAGLRERRGWSWRDLARALRDTAAQLGLPDVARVDLENLRRNVCRWESPTRPVRPDEWYQVILAHLYARQPGGGVNVGPGSDVDQLLEALAAFGVSETRLRELRDIVVRTAAMEGSLGLLAWLGGPLQADLAVALAAPDQVSENCLLQLRQAVAEITARIGVVPFTRLQVGLAPLVESCRRLLAGTQPAPLRQRLVRVAADAFALAARVAFELRDDDAARVWYARATDTARWLTDPWLHASVLTSRTMVTYYATGDVRAARRLAEHAAQHASRGGSAAMRARAAALQAEMTARAGVERHALAALHLAWHHADATPAEDPAGGQFTPGRLAGFEGVVRLHLGHADQARTTCSGAGTRSYAPRTACSA